MCHLSIRASCVRGILFLLRDKTEAFCSAANAGVSMAVTAPVKQFCGQAEGRNSKVAVIPKAVDHDT